MTEQQPRLFQIWLDASDGSIATYDGVQWPDGTADVHHRHRRPDGVQWTPEALARQIHGKLARIEWAPDPAATLATIREYLELSDDDGIRTRQHLLGLLDQAGVPSVVAAELAEGTVARPATQASGLARSGWLDVAKETLLAAEAKAKAEIPTARELGQCFAFATAALMPDAEPVFCHHENAVRTARTTMQAGWGRKTIHTVSCPACNASAEQVEGEPVLAPYLLNASRCTDACTERHTVRPGCLLAPDFSKPILRADRPVPPSCGHEH